ncbi:MAG TPA: hypothetical protein VGP76_11345 [Planctomycetaceae bacterium]|jgi:hypothetical protein|nr:hypothetical protein [Planctomycetaceae bacterium]
MSDESTGRTSRRKRGPIRTVVEVVLALSGIACMVVAASGGPFVWFCVGLTLFGIGTFLDPYLPC